MLSTTTPNDTIWTFNYLGCLCLSLVLYVSLWCQAMFVFFLSAVLRSLLQKRSWSQCSYLLLLTKSGIYKWGNILWRNGVHPSNRVPQTWQGALKLFWRLVVAWFHTDTSSSFVKQPSGQLNEHVYSALTGLLSMPALCWATLCSGAGQRLNFTKPSVSWKHTWVWQESVSEAARLSSFPSTKAEGLWLMCVCVPQCCVWETPWRRWRLPRGPYTFLTACWGSAWPSATSTEPCTLPVTTSCGLERQASSPNWTSTNGVRDLSGEWDSFFSFLCVCFNDKCICSTNNQK